MTSITIQYISDLHDKYPDIEPKCKYLALLGDIGNPFSRSYKNFIKQMSSKFEKVFIISGNHEYYCNTISSTDNKIEEICDETPNCIYFNNKSIFLDGFLIVGSTLWSNIDDKTVDYMNDFKYIYESPRDLLTPYTYRLKHHTSVGFIKSQIDKNMPTIVLTHHAPHKLMNGKYINSGFCSGFTTDLVHLNKNNNVKCWLSGHTHQCITVLINGIICSSNCLGYTNEGVENFELNKVLKVSS
jgi:predicted phosphodiesterase